MFIVYLCLAPLPAETPILVYWFRPLSTWALRNINLIDTSWLAFSYYIEHNMSIILTLQWLHRFCTCVDRSQGYCPLGEMHKLLQVMFVCVCPLYECA